MTPPPCYTCGKPEPAGNDIGGPYSAYGPDCQPRDTPINGSRCPACGKDFPSVQQFDVHRREAHEDRPVLRADRRTTLITIGADKIRVCEIPCRNDFLLDLKIPGGQGGGGWVYRGHGEAHVTVEWSGFEYDVAWKRCKPSALPCDLCWDEWQYLPVPALIAAAQVRSEQARRRPLPAGFVPFRPGDPRTG